jgi:magnesium-transporting ATPase (P-type)
MSIIVSSEEFKDLVFVFTKGADSAIYSILDETYDDTNIEDS